MKSAPLVHSFATIVFSLVVGSTALAAPIVCPPNSGNCSGVTVGATLDAAGCLPPSPTAKCVYPLPSSTRCVESCLHGTYCTFGNLGLTYSLRLSKLTAKYSQALFKCTYADAKAVCGGGSTNPACATKARTKYDTGVAKLSGGDPCVDPSTLANEIEVVVGKSFAEQTFCVNPCTNGTLDPSESDIDCGSLSCVTCGAGKICNDASDCTSGVCTAGLCD